MNSTILSRILRDARRAGLKTTISRLVDSARQAQKIAMLKVFPKRRGVEIKISEGHLSHSLERMMAGLFAAHSDL